VQVLLSGLPPAEEALCTVFVWLVRLQPVPGEPMTENYYYQDWKGHKVLIDSEREEDRRFGYYFALIPVKRLYVLGNWRWDFLRVNGDL